MTNDVMREYLHGYKKIIVKPSVDGISGIGVRMFVNENGTWIDTKTSQKLSVDSLDSGGGNFIVQEAVKQHAYINQFCESSVNTLRLSLYKSIKDDKCHVTAAIMRIGKKGSVVDNAHAGGCYVGIHSDGTFCHEVLDQYGRKSTVFNDIDFSNNYRYPNWEKVIEFGESVGKYVPHHRLIALDIVLDEDGNPHLIEFNVLGYSTWLFQYTTNAAWGDYTDEILEYCTSRNKELEYILYL